MIGIICVAVGRKKLIAYPWARPHDPVQLLLAPGVVGLWLPALAVAVLVLLVLVALNATEAWWVASGRALLIVRVPRWTRRSPSS